MRPGRVVRLVAGTVLAVLGVPLLLAGLVLGWFHLAERDDDGWFSTSTETLATETHAIVSGEVDLGARRDDWRLGDDAAVTVRVRAAGDDLFVGIGPSAEVDAYLRGVPREVVLGGAFVPGGLRTERFDGTAEPSAPATQGFWAATGSRQVVWEVEPGNWTLVVMRADGGAGVDATVSAAVRVPWLLPLAVGLLLGGAALTLLGCWACVSAVRHEAARSSTGPHPEGAYPLRLRGRLDEPLSRWQWLVKWVLALPHVLVLVPLWIAFGAATVVAFFAILVTGRYPRALFDFCAGVLRWTWRVSFYAFSAIGTDRYPPFSLAPDPAYPADLEITHPPRLSRGLVLVKWWLLALPHYLVVVVLTGGVGVHAAGVATALCVVAGVVLLASGSYPRALFDVVMGCNRWAYRVLAYAALMTDEYPPFRFDAGGEDPPVRPEPGPEPPAEDPTRELVGTA